MALFKILRGLQKDYANKEKIDGQILICTDTGNIYVDFVEEGKTEVKRVQLNADKANKLTYIWEDTGEEILIGVEEFIAVFDALSSDIEMLGLNKWSNDSSDIDINNAHLTADPSDGEVGDTLTIATKEYVESMIGDVASLLAAI